MSREIDRRIALEVMGKVPCGDPTMVADGSGLLGYTIPHYSTDVFRAMQVVERMRANRGTFRVWPGTNPANAYVVEFGKATDDGGPKGQAESSSFCEAVCLAALRALGVDAGEGKK
jgi:hypothetical protein